MSYVLITIWLQKLFSTSWLRNLGVIFVCSVIIKHLPLPFVVSLSHTIPSMTPTFSLQPWMFSMVFFFPSSLTTPSSTSFVQYVHYPSSLHVQSIHQPCLSTFVSKLRNLSPRFNFSIHALFFPPPHWKSEHLQLIFNSPAQPPVFSVWSIISKPYIMASSSLSRKCSLSLSLLLNLLVKLNISNEF